MYEFKLGASGFMYFSQIPWVKRYTFRLEYVYRSYLLNFTGATTGEDVSNAYVIPSGESYVESNSFLLLTVGFRFDDFIGLFFNPR